MTFAELLDQYIGYKALVDVAGYCAASGVRIDPSLLSRLRTGHRPAPADERTVKVIAEACGKDPAPLVLLAKMERQPAEVFRAILEALAESGQPTAKTVAELAAMVKGLRPAEQRVSGTSRGI